MYVYIYIFMPPGRVCRKKGFFLGFILVFFRDSFRVSLGIHLGFHLGFLVFEFRIYGFRFLGFRVFGVRMTMLMMLMLIMILLMMMMMLMNSVEMRGYFFVIHLPRWTTRRISQNIGPAQSKRTFSGSTSVLAVIIYLCIISML